MCYVVLCYVLVCYCAISVYCGVLCGPSFSNVLLSDVFLNGILLTILHEFPGQAVFTRGNMDKITIPGKMRGRIANFADGR